MIADEPGPRQARRSPCLVLRAMQRRLLVAATFLAPVAQLDRAPAF